MDTTVVSNSTIRRRARRDIDQRLQQMRDDYSATDLVLNAGNREDECIGSGEMVVEDEFFFNEELIGEEGSENDASVVEEDIDMGTDIFDHPRGGSLDLSEEDSEENSDEDSDEEPLDEPCTLSDSICNWALTFGISLVALTALLGLLRIYHPHLPKDARTILKTNTKYTLLQKFGGLYHYFGILSSIKNTLSQISNSVSDGFTLMLQINVDGLPLFKSSGVQLWPILGLLLSVPMKEPVVIGLFCGRNKPKSAEEFLKDFVVELQELESGFDFNGKRLFLRVDSVVCDAPARAFMKNIKAHNAYYGCDKCEQHGQYLNRRMTFPLTDCKLRTDESFAQKLNEEHHHSGPSPLHGSSVGMVSQFPLDYMHLVCLGVVRKLLVLWLRGPLNCRLPASIVNRMCAHLVDLRPHIPVEFARKPRSLREIDRFKATEFRLFLLYIGPVILHSYLDSKHYNNFMLLFSAISILVSPELSVSYWQYAQTLLQTFVIHFGDLYGKDTLVYNVHSLVHLPLDVQQHGYLDRFSAFPYENHLQKLKKLVRKPERPLPQIIRRLSELPTGRTTSMVSSSLKKSHFVGPIPSGIQFPVHCQYREMHTDKWTIKVSTGDNTFIIGDDVCMIYNIIQSMHSEYVVYRVFSEKSDFFTYPFKSDFLNIYCISQPSGPMKCAKVSAITQKCIVLPQRRGFVAMPLLHTREI